MKQVSFISPSDSAFYGISIKHLIFNKSKVMALKNVHISAFHVFLKHVIATAQSATATLSQSVWILNFFL